MYSLLIDCESSILLRLSHSGIAVPVSTPYSVVSSNPMQVLPYRYQGTRSTTQYCQQPAADNRRRQRRPLWSVPTRGTNTLFLPGGTHGAPGPADDAPDSLSGASSPSRQAGGLDISLSRQSYGRGEGLLPKMHLVHCVCGTLQFMDSNCLSLSPNSN